MNTSFSLRSTFNTAAREYDAIRPGYPEELINDVMALSGMPEGGEALEIGCGTGQATVPFARRGCSILCLDIGSDLLAIAKENLRDYPKVSFLKTSFEDWPARLGAFDLVYSATAFHWVPREIGYPKAALALKPGGSLAVFINKHPRLLQTGIFEEIEPIYRQFVPEWRDPKNQLSIEVEMQNQADYINSTRLFAPVVVRTYPWSHTYTTQEYLRLLHTYSDHISLEENCRRSLYEAIADLIERRYGGKVERPYLSVLYLAKKA